MQMYSTTTVLRTCTLSEACEKRVCPAHPKQELHHLPEKQRHTHTHNIRMYQFLCVDVGNGGRIRGGAMLAQHKCRAYAPLGDVRLKCARSARAHDVHRKFIKVSAD